MGIDRYAVIVAMSMKRSLLLAACLVMPMPAWAGCDQFFPDWVQSLAPGRDADEASMTCKPWPANPALTLATVSFWHEANADGEREGDVLLLVADSQSGAVQAHLLETATLYAEDGRLPTVALDSAAYQLTPTQRAFGIRRSSEDGSKLIHLEFVWLDLYVIEGKALRNVLGMMVRADSTEWEGRCAGKFNTTTRTIAVGPAGKQGYAALRVAQRAAGRVETGTCIESKETVRRSAFTLHYGDGRYVVPDALKNMDAD